MKQNKRAASGFFGIKFMIASFSLASMIGVYTLIALKPDVDEVDAAEDADLGFAQAPLPTIVPAVSVVLDVRNLDVQTIQTNDPQPTPQAAPPKIETVIIKIGSQGSSGSTVTSSSR